MQLLSGEAQNVFLATFSLCLFQQDFSLSVNKAYLYISDNEKFAWNSFGSQWSVHHV